MPQNYSGSTAGLSGRPTVTIAEPVGTDQRNAGSVQTPFRKLADFAAYLMTNAAFLGANVFTATQQIASGGLELTQAALQAILKKGSGKLQVGTATGNTSDVELLVNGVAKATLRASDGKLQGQSTAIGDAGTTLASKDYVDGLQPGATPAWTAVAAPTNWNEFGSTYSPSGAPGVAYLKNYGIAHLSLSLKRTTSGYASGDAIVTLPVGHRPRTEVPLRVSIIDGATGARSSVDGTISALGNVVVHAAVPVGTWVVLQASFPAS
jgi:hypothetical protein